MSKTEDFIVQEKNIYGKTYVDISYALSNISPFIEESDLRRRKYVTKISTLKKYMELLDSAAAESKKLGFKNFFSGDKYTDLLNSYKRDHKDDFKQLEKCSGCQCLNCTALCKFDSCLGCRFGSKIVSCDHRRINVTFHDDFMLNLTNNNTGTEDRYLVLATLQDVEKEQKYIIMENIRNKDKFVLYYYPGISEENYGEIEDGEEMDFIVSTFQSVEQ